MTEMTGSLLAILISRSMEIPEYVEMSQIIRFYTYNKCERMLA